MTKAEFGAILAYLSAAVGKPVTDQQAEVYFDLLGDLPAAVLRAAAQQALLESQYPTLPPVGQLRKLATAALEGRDRIPTAAEAWECARRAVVRFGYCREAEGLASVSGLVRRTLECLGWVAVCDSTEPEIVRAQFVRAYESLASREHRERLLPAAVKEAIAKVGQAPADVLRLTDGIGGRRP